MKTTISWLAILTGLLFIPGRAFAQSQCHVTNYRDFIFTEGIHNCDLSNTILFGVNMWRANLQGANFQGAYLARADFCGTNVTDANFSGANLARAYFCGANLLRAIFWENVLEDGSKEMGAQLEGADFRGAKNMSQELIEYARAQGAILDI